MSSVKCIDASSRTPQISGLVEDDSSTFALHGLRFPVADFMQREMESKGQGKLAGPCFLEPAMPQKAFLTGTPPQAPVPGASVVETPAHSKKRVHEEIEGHPSPRGNAPQDSPPRQPNTLAKATSPGLGPSPQEARQGHLEAQQDVQDSKLGEEAGRPSKLRKLEPDSSGPAATMPAGNNPALGQSASEGSTKRPYGALSSLAEDAPPLHEESPLKTPSVQPGALAKATLPGMQPPPLAPSLQKMQEALQQRLQMQGPKNQGASGPKEKPRRLRLNAPTGLSLGGAATVPGSKARPKLLDHLDFSNLPPFETPAELSQSSSLSVGNSIGSGATGVVTPILITKGNQTVATPYVGKAPTMDERGDDATVARRFMREVTMNAELSQIERRGQPLPGFVVGKGIVTPGGLPRMVMDHLEGGPVDKKLDALYEQCLDGTLKPADLVAQVKKFFRPIVESTAVANGNGIVVGDWNAYNLLFDDKLGHARRIDFGLAGREGKPMEIGATVTAAPECFLYHHTSEAHEKPPVEGSSPKPEGSVGPSVSTSAQTFHPAIDSYGLGGVMLRLVNGKYSTWFDQTGQVSQGAYKLAASATAERFIEKGHPAFGSALDVSKANMRAASGEDDGTRTQRQEAEAALRNELLNAGFYDLLHGLMQPKADVRMTTQRAVEHRFFSSEPAA